MKTPPTQYYKGYTHLNGSWYVDSMPHTPAVDEVMIGLYHEDGGTAGEFAIRWYAGSPPSPRLEVHGDAWHVLATHFQDLIRALGAAEAVTPEVLCQMLREQGLRDRTEKHAPRKRFGSP